MRALLVALALAMAPAAFAAPPGLDAPPLAAKPIDALDARTIVERATAAAGGETWRRPKTLLLKGYSIFYGPNGQPLVNDRHTMWRVYPDWKPAAHKADGKVRIESVRDGKTVILLSFDGTTSYTEKGPLPPSDADKQWAENFGFGVIRFALDPGYTLTRLPDDLVNGRAAYTIEVADPTGAKTQFSIERETFHVVRVGFATARGWHERIYSDFYTKPGVAWVQPGRIRLLYNGVKQNDLVWTDFELNAPMPDDLFVIKAPAKP